MGANAKRRRLDRAFARTAPRHVLRISLVDAAAFREADSQTPAPAGVPRPRDGERFGTATCDLGMSEVFLLGASANAAECLAWLVNFHDDACALPSQRTALVVADATLAADEAALEAFGAEVMRRAGLDVSSIAVHRGPRATAHAHDSKGAN